MRLGLRAVVIVLAAALLLLSASGLMDRGIDRGLPPVSPQHATEILRRVQVRAAAAYALARVLGGVIAVASSTTAQGGIAVAGVSVDVGKALQPASQLLDAFGDVMMASLISVTAQIILIEIADAYALPYLLPVGLGLLIVAALLGSPPGGGWRRFALLVIFLALAGKFVLPAAVSATDLLSQRFLQAHEAEAARDVQLAGQEMPGAGSDTRSWYDPRRIADMVAALSPSEIVGKIDRAVQGILTWMTVFLLETIVFPLAITIGLVAAGRVLLRRAVAGTLPFRRPAPA